MRVHLRRKGFEAAKALSYFYLALVLLRGVQYAQERCPAALYGSDFEDTFLSPLQNYNTHCHTGSDVTIEFIHKTGVVTRPQSTQYLMIPVPVWKVYGHSENRSCLPDGTGVLWLLAGCSAILNEGGPRENWERQQRSASTHCSHFKCQLSPMRHSGTAHAHHKHCACARRVRAGTLQGLRMCRVI